MKADPEKITLLLKTARGQIDGILKMVEEDRYCMNISHQLLACEAILRKANSEVLAAHMKSCVKDAFESSDPDEADIKTNELLDLINKMLK